MKYCKQYFSIFILLACMCTFGGCKAANVIYFSKQNRTYFPRTLSDKLVIDGAAGEIKQELPDMSNFSSVLLIFKETCFWETVYDAGFGIETIGDDENGDCVYTMTINFYPDGNSFCYKLWLDGNIHCKLQDPRGNILLKNDALDFELLQEFFNLQGRYDSLEAIECDQNLKSRKQYLYIAMLLRINMLLNNLSR
ncbi:MAG: hypothetical protein LBR79_04800 [Oscillospiraceae bacterium]|nr:hypothetical protein [Oscillospiraceae bacterium]